ncbi:MAG: hypothetical protein ACRDPE_04560 [Solirubrobacterales bacterium]
MFDLPVTRRELPPEPSCQCPIRVREIDRPLMHSKSCPVRVAYGRYLAEADRAESERRWAA